MLRDAVHKVRVLLAPAVAHTVVGPLRAGRRLVSASAPTDAMAPSAPRQPHEGERHGAGSEEQGWRADGGRVVPADNLEVRAGVVLLRLTIAAPLAPLGRALPAAVGRRVRLVLH